MFLLPQNLTASHGLRPIRNEKEGIRRSRHELELAELVLLVIDSHDSAEKLQGIEFDEFTRVIRILNKSDLSRHPDWDGTEGIEVSCLDPSAGDELRELLYREIALDRAIRTTSLTAINSRHQHCLRKAAEAVKKSRACLDAGKSPEFVAMDLRSALEAVGEVVGKTDVEEILGEIFSTFCIGK